MFFHLNACSARGVVNEKAFDDGQFWPENDLGRARNPARRTDALKQALVLHGRILLLKSYDNATAQRTGRRSIRTSPGIISRRGRHDVFRRMLQPGPLKSGASAPAKSPGRLYLGLTIPPCAGGPSGLPVLGVPRRDDTPVRRSDSELEAIGDTSRAHDKMRRRARPA